MLRIIFPRLPKFQCHCRRWVRLISVICRKNHYRSALELSIFVQSKLLVRSNVSYKNITQRFIDSSWDYSGTYTLKGEKQCFSFYRISSECNSYLQSHPIHYEVQITWSLQNDSSFVSHVYQKSLDYKTLQRPIGNLEGQAVHSSQYQLAGMWVLFGICPRMLSFL